MDLIDRFREYKLEGLVTGTIQSIGSKRREGEKDREGGGEGGGREGEGGLEIGVAKFDLYSICHKHVWVWIKWVRIVNGSTCLICLYIRVRFRF